MFDLFCLLVLVWLGGIFGVLCAIHVILVDISRNTRREPQNEPWADPYLKEQRREN